MQELNNHRYVTVAVDRWTAMQFDIVETKGSTTISETLTILQPDGTTKTQSRSVTFTIGHGRN